MQTDYVVQRDDAGKKRRDRRVLCVCGEASGDTLLAPVVAGLVAHGVDVIGLGGVKSLSAGLRPVNGASLLNTSGLVEALGELPRLLETYRTLRRRVSTAHALLLVDCPELNIRLAKHANRLGIPVYYLAPPQAWAWRPWRAKRLRAVAQVGCLFDFEKQWFVAHGVDAEWVGHPLVSETPLKAAQENSVALFPGSRPWECKSLLPVMLSAIELIQRDGVKVVAHLAVAPAIPLGLVARLSRDSGVELIVHRDARDALEASRVALCAAGTASLEAALGERPVLILGRVHPVSAWIARRLVKVDHIGLPNLILGRRAFPELVQEDVQDRSISRVLRELLEAPEHFDVDFADLRSRMRRPTSAPWAAGIVDTVVNLL